MYKQNKNPYTLDTYTSQGHLKTHMNMNTYSRRQKKIPNSVP